MKFKLKSVESESKVSQDSVKSQSIVIQELSKSRPRVVLVSSLKTVIQLHALVNNLVIPKLETSLFYNEKHLRTKDLFFNPNGINFVDFNTEKRKFIGSIWNINCEAGALKLEISK